MKIAIIYADYGSGHKSVALNLKKVLKDHDVDIYNARKESQKHITKISEYMYNNFITKNASKRIIKDSYHISYKVVGSSKILSHVLVKRIGYKFVQDLIEGENLDLIITTFPSYISDPKVKTLTVITDYTIDNTWYDKRTDYYFAPSQEVKEKLVNKKVNPLDIYVTGIPLNKKYEQTNNETYVKKILFNLGARGQVKFKNLIMWIDYALSKNVKVTIITGKNAKLYKKVKARYNNRVIIYGFTSRVAEILSKNDLVLTKAGGLSVSECLMSEKPMIINIDQSLKGQEKTNYDYIQKYELGLIGKEKNIISKIEYYLANPQNYIKTIKNIQKIKVYDQEKKIVKIINELKIDKNE